MRELLQRVRDRPGMYIPNGSFECFVYFAHGADCALDCKPLRGFTKWLTMRYGAASNRHWTVICLDDTEQRLPVYGYTGECEKIEWLLTELLEHLDSAAAGA